MTTDRTVDQIAAETAMCPYCHARPGKECRTVKPRPGVVRLRKGLPTATHTSRLRPVNEGYAQGYQDAAGETR